MYFFGICWSSLSDFACGSYKLDKTILSYQNSQAKFGSSAELSELNVSYIYGVTS